MEETEPPFTSEIMNKVMPSRFRMPPIIQFSESGDPSEHVKSYCSWMQVQSTIDAMMCRAFSITLSGSARSWYRQLKTKSISSFSELNRMFLTQFISGKKSQKLTTHLFTLKQGNKEPLKDYIVRFNEEALLVEDYDDKMTLSAMFSGLTEGKFTFSIGKNPPTTLAELINRAQKYTNAEEFSNSRRNIQAAEASSKEKRSRNEEPQTSNKKPDDRVPRDRRLSRRPEGKFRSYTPLKTSMEEILLDIRGQRLLNEPVCMKTDVENRDKRKYCRFHRDHDHNTSDYVDLKDEIETLIRKGHLCRYTKEERSAKKKERPSKVMEEHAKIRTIYGGPSGGGDSNRARKAHSRSLDPEHYVHLTKRPRKELRVSPCNLTFTEDDACGIHHPHENVLVVAMTIANHKVFRILVDTGSSVDIIYSEAFKRMRIDRSYLRPMKTPLHDFAEDKVISKGAISLPVTAGEGQHQVTLLVDFLVVNVPSVHNVILRRHSLNAMRAVVSTYHLIMKFPAEGGVGYL
ncbi:uncharacterized protein LOC131244282 [Magnolia sinica]|uniref:uncharacterized protein LOC131244282 n=1 Tax=Magnolia sinica TaxID=86752 RepID=UPI002658AFF7|nr:uncharacterized protein LOC131244282 [Magnolia sinica]